MNYRRDGGSDVEKRLIRARKWHISGLFGSWGKKPDYCKEFKRFRLTNVILANLNLFLLCIFDKNKKVCKKPHHKRPKNMKYLQTQEK